MRALAASLLVVASAALPDAAAAGRTAPSGVVGVEVARIVAVTPVRPRAGAGPILRLLPTRTSWSGEPQQLLVLGDGPARDGRRWLRVRLPGRPNGSSGWIRRDAVVLRRDPWSIDVSLSRRTVRVFRDGRLVRRLGAVVGAPATPTPTGLFAVYELNAQPDPNGFLGPWALQLTAFSTVLERYGGGPGRVAIHGRGGVSLRDPLGTARSHGCVRVDNSEVRWLARTIPPGTPVRIR